MPRLRIDLPVALGSDLARADRTGADRRRRTRELADRRRRTDVDEATRAFLRWFDCWASA
ncbi:MAG: hypothetical protein ABEJ40_07840 [Haloarculaceae archaeon]